MPRSRRRVLQLRSSCGLYGAERVALALARAGGPDWLTACLDDRRAPHLELLQLLEAERLPAARVRSDGAFDVRLLPRLARLVRSFRPDLLQTHDYKSDVLGALAARAFRLPHVATVHLAHRQTWALRRYEELDAFVLRRAHAVVAVSARTAADARMYGVARGRLHLVPNGVDTDHFAPGLGRDEARTALGLAPDAFVVGVAARLSAEKGHVHLLEALVHGALPANVELVFAGDGPCRRRLEEHAAALGLGARVHFAGVLGDVRVLYAACDVVALPSLAEGLPLALLEAAACARPLIGTDVGDVRLVVEDGTSGWLVSPGSGRALAGAVRAAVESSQRHAYGLAARRRVVERFGVSAMVASYERVHASALAASPRSAPAPVTSGAA